MYTYMGTWEPKSNLLTFTSQCSCKWDYDGYNRLRQVHWNSCAFPSVSVKMQMVWKKHKVPLWQRCKRCLRLHSLKTLKDSNWKNLSRMTGRPCKPTQRLWLRKKDPPGTMPDPRSWAWDSHPHLPTTRSSLQLPAKQTPAQIYSFPELRLSSGCTTGNGIYFAEQIT